MMEQLTFRARLTIAYTALFTVSGIVLLAITYYLVERQLPSPFGGAKINIQGVLDPEAQNKIFVAVQRDAEALRTTTLTTLLTQGGAALLLILVISSALGWLMAGRMLKPLQQMTETATRIAKADSAGRGLHERIALTGPHDEVRRLADAFDLMLARLDQSFDGQRRFVANASHELRTPLALNRALVELAITRHDVTPDAQRLGDALLKVNERHERLIEGLLVLADSETELAEKEPVDLAEIARHILVTVDSASTALAPAPTTGDPVLLERLIQNLVENAVKHNLPAGGGWVRVESGLVNGRAQVIVSNTGPVVPAYEIETIFQPFRRLGRERVGGPSRGLGLGLSIVRAIARAHGGQVQAAPRPGGGLTVTATL